MNIAFVRRLIYLASAVLLLCAAIVVPGLVAPQWTANMVRRLPDRVARRLGRLIPPERGPQGIDRETLAEALRPKEETPRNQDATMERYAVLEWAITGERPAPVETSQRASGPLDQYVKVLLTFASPNPARSGGFAVLDLQNVPSPRRVAVAEGDSLDLGGTPATVKKVMKDTVVFEYMNRDHVMYRDGLSPADRRALEEARRRSSDQQSEAAAPDATAVAAVSDGDDEPAASEAHAPEGHGSLQDLLRGAQVQPHIENLAIIGYQISSIQPGSPAARHGLLPGDIVVSAQLNGQTVPVSDADTWEEQEAPEGPVALLIRRDGQERTLVLSR